MNSHYLLKYQTLFFIYNISNTIFSKKKINKLNQKQSYIFFFQEEKPSPLFPLKRTLQAQKHTFKSHFSYHLYFMRGTDSRVLQPSAFQDFAKLVREDPFGASFLIYNRYEALSKLAAWKRALPWITPHYAIKSNPIKPLLQEILSYNGCFDCASKGEISVVLKLGGDANKIIYSNPVKNEKDLKWAYKVGVPFTTADTMDELIKIKKYAPGMKVLWRITIKEDSHLLKANFTPFSGKFGDDIGSAEEAEQRFKEIRQMGIKLHGIHFHCGSAQHGSPYFAKAVNLARVCMDIGRQQGHSMELLDVGGGFPSGEINSNVIEALKNTYNDPLGYQVVAEPGRHFSSNTCLLAMRILTRRIKNHKLCYHVNESLYHSFNCILMDGVSFEKDQNQFYASTDSTGHQENLGDQESCSIFGMTCDGRDVIAENCLMPKNMQVGDWMILGGMGSYTYGPKSKFNGMKSTQKIKNWSGELVEEKTLQEQIEQQSTLVRQRI